MRVRSVDWVYSSVVSVVPQLSQMRVVSSAVPLWMVRRAGQLVYRDDVVRRALEAGVSWSRVRGVTGLSARGLQLVVRRIRSTR